ncbi:MAG: hypothetical protein Q7J47_14930 [Azoarcus sp.]|jgi:hypothetical protein|nr:hypothetical protein [Azoarcus sp.]
MHLDSVVPGSLHQTDCEVDYVFTGFSGAEDELRGSVAAMLMEYIGRPQRVEEGVAKCA